MDPVSSLHSCLLCAANKKEIKESTNYDSKKPLEEIELALNPVQRTIQLSAKAFNCIAEDFTALSDARYLPEKTDLPKYASLPARNENLPNRDDLLRLCYLTTLQPSTQKCPITKSQEDIFQKSIKSDATTSRWLGWKAFALGGVVAIGSGAAAYLGLINFSKDDTENKAKQFSLIASAQAVASFTLFAFGMFWTGMLPDKSSIDANKKQNAMVVLRKHYRNLATELAKLYFTHRELAVNLAKEMNIPVIRSKIVEYANESDADQIIDFDALESVIQYINSDGRQLPTDNELAQFIRVEERLHHS